MSKSILHRIAIFDSPAVSITVDGIVVSAQQGESVLAAILKQCGYLRRHETNGEPRAGFCLMGACQDCLVWVSPSQRARACSTPVSDGMQISTSSTPIATAHG